MYEPREDSHLLKKHIKDYVKEDMEVLDMCAGTGILAEEAMHYTTRVLAVDSDKEAVVFMEKKNINAVQSNLFSDVMGTFDVILCNPPYLPIDADEPKDSALATTGGKEGNEFTLEFLEEAKNHLAPSGTILLIQSSLAPPLEEQDTDYALEKIDEHAFPMEKILLYALTLKG